MTIPLGTLIANAHAEFNDTVKHIQEQLEAQEYNYADVLIREAEDISEYIRELEDGLALMEYIDTLETPKTRPANPGHITLGESK